MLKRKATERIKEWAQGEEHKALLITGARQVGKSYLAKSICSEIFERCVIFDMLEDASIRRSFAEATSADDLMLRISIASSKPLVEGRTAIVIDEVQECPEILTYIKYLVQDTSYRFVLTGSLLGVKLENIDSLPVGYVSLLKMFPLDFEEFCWANGLDGKAFGVARECLNAERPLPDFLYERLLALFHRYLMVGGMPDAVNSFIGRNNIDAVRAIHNDLHSLYRADITKHAPIELRLILQDIYNLIPTEITAKSRRFKFSDIKGVKRFSQVEQHFLWLSNAGVALPVFNVSELSSPLLLNLKRNLFKLFYLDAGMLASRFPKSSYEGLLDGRPSMNMGGVYEAFVAQELTACQVELRYYSSKTIGEIDFVEETTDGCINALEVKSGPSYKNHAALDNALASESHQVDKAFVLAETNIRREGRVLYLPVFLAGMISER